MIRCLNALLHKYSVAGMTQLQITFKEYFHHAYLSKGLRKKTKSSIFFCSAIFIFQVAIGQSVCDLDQFDLTQLDYLPDYLHASKKPSCDSRKSEHEAEHHQKKCHIIVINLQALWNKKIYQDSAKKGFKLLSFFALSYHFLFSIDGTNWLMLLSIRAGQKTNKLSHSSLILINVLIDIWPYILSYVIHEILHFSNCDTFNLCIYFVPFSFSGFQSRVIFETFRLWHINIITLFDLEAFIIGLKWNPDAFRFGPCMFLLSIYSYVNKCGCQCGHCVTSDDLTALSRSLG